MSAAHARELEELVQQNRFWRRLAGGALAGLFALLATAAFAPEEPGALRATQLEIVDAAGRVRASLGVDGDECMLSLRDASGVEHAQLFTSDREALLRMTDHKDARRVVLTTGFNDHGLYFSDPDGNDRVSLVALDEAGLFFTKDRGLFAKNDDDVVTLVTDR